MALGIWPGKTSLINLRKKQPNSTSSFPHGMSVYKEFTMITGQEQIPARTPASSGIVGLHAHGATGAFDNRSPTRQRKHDNHTGPQHATPRSREL
jgi:hypothetical protein